MSARSPESRRACPLPFRTMSVLKQTIPLPGRIFSFAVLFGRLKDRARSASTWSLINSRTLRTKMTLCYLRAGPEDVANGVHVFLLNFGLKLVLCTGNEDEVGFEVVSTFIGESCNYTRRETPTNFVPFHLAAVHTNHTGTVFAPSFYLSFSARICQETTPRGWTRTSEEPLGRYKTSNAATLCPDLAFSASTRGESSLSSGWIRNNHSYPSTMPCRSCKF